MAIRDIAEGLANSMSGLAHTCKGKIIREKPYVEDYSTDSSSSVVKSGKLASVDPTFGCDASLKTFYEGKNSNANYFDWVDSPPKQVSKKVAKANDRVAIKVYKIKDLEKPVLAGIFALKYHMIEVQSPVLVSALKDIMKKEDMHLEPTEVATFKQPFRPLWFRYEEISALYRKTTETTLKSHMSVFMKLLSEIFGGVKTHLTNLQSSGLINFKYAWMYFPKDALVYSPNPDCERICKVVDTEIITDQRSRKHLIIKAEELAFDGEGFAWRDTLLDIPAFEGNRPIRELDHYPLTFAEEPSAIKGRLADRGKKVLQYQGLTYCEYEGLGLFTEEAANVRGEKHNVSCRILIDIYGYQKHHEALKRTSGKDHASSKKRKNARSAPPPANSDFIIDPETLLPVINQPVITTTTMTLPEGKKDEFYIKRLTEEEQTKNRDEMLAKPDELCFLSPMLEGYALKNKMWCKYNHKKFV